MVILIDSFYRLITRKTAALIALKHEINSSR